VAPRPVLSGHRQLALDPLVVRSQVVVRDRPVRAHAVEAVGVEVGGVEPGAVAGVVHHRPADAATGVVAAHRDRVGAADDPLLRPVQLVRAGLVAHPVLVGVPERARLEDDDLPAVPGQPLGEHRPAGAGADDDEVDLVAVGVPRHRVLTGQVARVHVEQVARVVVLGADGSLEDAAEQVAHQ